MPIIEPDIVIDGDHDIELCAKVSQKVLSVVMRELLRHNLLIEGLLLKPNMVTPGKNCAKRATPEEVAWMTVRTLSRTIVPSYPTICFLSGGQSEEEASLNLNAINRLKKEKGGLPWNLTFSFARAL